MSRTNYLQVHLPLSYMVEVQSLADRESRSLSSMGAVLIREALASRADLGAVELKRLKRLADANHLAWRLNAILDPYGKTLCRTCKRASALVGAYLDGDK